MNWQNILYSLPGIILGLTIHEYCHALAAYKLGDPTARDMGRLTFNPVKHIDPIGSLFIIFAGFGWAKPVQFNPENLRHPRLYKAIIAAAGPLSNLVLALALVALFRALQTTPELTVNYTILIIILRAAMINLGLFIFNLFPIPPLDGSHIVFSGLNLSQETQIKIMKIGGPLLFLILIIQNTTNITILPIGRLIMAILTFLL